MWTSHLTQIGIGLVNACGPACVAMLVNMYYRYRHISVRDAANKVGNGVGFSTFQALDNALTALGVPAKWVGNITMAWLIAMLDAGIPVIVLVSYSAFTDRPYNYKSAHFVLVVAINSFYVTCYDPLRPGGPTRFPRAEFEAAMSQSSRYPRKPTPDNPSEWGYNNPNQAMIPEIALTDGDFILMDMRRLLRW